MKMNMKRGAVLLCCLLLAGCGSSKTGSAVSESAKAVDNERVAAVPSVTQETLEENSFQTEVLTADQEKIARFFAGAGYHLFQYSVSEDYTKAVITGVHFQKGTEVSEDTVLEYSLEENGNAGRLAVWDDIDSADLTLKVGTDTATQSRTVSLENAYDIHTDATYPVSKEEMKYTVQKGERYPFFLITCGDEPPAASFDKMVEDTEHELKDVEDCVVFYLQFE